DAARTKLDLLLAQSAGFASQSQLQGRRDRVYSTVLRVPEGKFGETIKAIKDLGRVVAESLETEDVTSEFVDTEARIRNLTRTEARLLDILEKVAGNLAEILPVESELNRVRGEIETLTARTKQIEELVALATVSVTLYEESLDVIEEPDDIWKPFRQLKRNAGALLKKSFGALVAVFAAIANFLIVILPWAVLLALILVVRPGWRRGLMGLFSRRPRPK
ncbi:MAG: DUF4349 domain-containing protein, partial [Planctomycetes bacterium]|nr:DUF4349 domain-containing protein [Planctomycetota bacterium]